MKVRNSGSKVFHRKQSVLYKNYSIFQLMDKLAQTQMETSFSSKQNISSRKSKIKIYKQIISKCYNRMQEQINLCKAMKIPFIQGPVSLNQIPQSFLQFPYIAEGQKAEIALTQLNYLFEFLKKTKEYYYCWVIYFHEEFKILTLKMLKKYQVEQNLQIFRQDCMVGIFAGRIIQKKSFSQYINTSKEQYTRSPQLNTKSNKSNTISCHQNSANQPKKKQYQEDQSIKTSFENYNFSKLMEYKSKSKSKLKSKSNTKLISWQFLTKERQSDSLYSSLHSLNPLNSTTKTLKTVSDTNHTNSVSKSMSSTFVSVTKENQNNQNANYLLGFKKIKQAKKEGISYCNGALLNPKTDNFGKQPKNLKLLKKNKPKRDQQPYNISGIDKSQLKIKNSHKHLDQQQIAKKQKQNHKSSLFLCKKEVRHKFFWKNKSYTNIKKNPIQLFQAKQSKKKVSFLVE